MRVQQAIFPGLIIGIIFLVTFTSFLLSRPSIGKAVIQTGGSFGIEEAAVVTNGMAGQSAEISEGCSISDAYPEAVRQWCGIIDQYARENGIDPNLVSAVMLQESAGKPDAYSKSGAVGLLQVMPRDGKAAGFQCINGPCFSTRPTMEELFDPEYNIAYGTQMLAGLIQKHGDLREALRAYGPMDVGYYYADLVIGIMNSHR